MDEIKTKQQVVEKIKEANKILVTVSRSPSVDELSAALALTLILDKQEKYATAIFSGETPPAIAFLEPEKTFDDTTDSLRDFIIALNKEKADHLRYKVVDDAVKIFITPYKTTIDETDLEFSQGDYNVELVIALGVDNQDDLDKALEDHGQILHDAAIITMTAGDNTSTLGGIDWHDSNSSSLSEMIAGLAEALKVDKKKPLLDGPIATALLTGIVAETDRFSNERTSSRAMTVAGNLMAAGADQQLIANELQASQEAPEAPADEPEAPEDTNDDEEASDVEIDTSSNDGSMSIKKDHDATALNVSHEGETLADLDLRVLGEKKAKKKVIAEVAKAEADAAIAEKAEEAQASAYGTPATELAKEDVAPSVESAADTAPSQPVGSAYAAEEIGEEPSFGGALNATTEQAADDARREIENDQNRTILSHSAFLGGDDPAPVNAYAPDAEPAGFPGAPPAAPGSVGVNDLSSSDNSLHSAYAFSDGPAAAEAPEQLGGSLGSGRVIQPLSEQAAAPEAVNTAYAAPAPEATAAPAPAPVPAYTPAPEPLPQPAPADLGLPLPPPIPDFSQVNAGVSAPAIPLPPTQQPAILGDILAPEPQPQFQPPVAPEPQLPPAPQPVAADPGQFQIPSQQ
ncbi:MAG: hypothetical protein ACREGE_04330 [Candidatus Microsaccharimonas sp.]